MLRTSYTCKRLYFRDDNIVESDNDGGTNMRPKLMISGDGISKAIVKIRKNSITHQDEPNR